MKSRRSKLRDIGHILVVATTMSLASLATSAHAAETVVDTEPFQLRLGGFLSEFAALTHVPYDTAGVVPEYSGQNAGVLRFEWTGQAGDNVSFELHNRFFHRLSTTEQAASSGLGLGTSVAPDRTLDARTAFVDEGDILVEHDLDRAVVNWFTPLGDVYVGRQAITWGNSNLFPVADVWTRFSPFELDTSQKRGVDAVRFIGYPGGIELDVVLEWTDLDAPGGGVRAAWTLDRAESYGALAWYGDRLHGFMGLGLDLDVVRAHGEFNLPFDPETGTLELPRAVFGVDYLSQEFTALIEYHYSGPGASDPDGYLAEAQDRDVVDGERYLFGRHYLGGTVAWVPNETYTLSLSSIANLLDPSAIVIPTATVNVSQNVSASAGAYIGVGERPTLVPTPGLNSEFGPAGETYFLQMTAFF
jgi:hypothetical protein